MADRRAEFVNRRAVVTVSAAALIGPPVVAVVETVQTALPRVVYSDQHPTPQQAITAAGSGGTVIFPRGATTTLTSPLLLDGLSNIRLVGFGHAMRSGGTRINGYIDCSGASNVIIEGFDFDGRQADMPVYTQVDFAANHLTCNAPVVANGATAAWSDITVRNCTLTGMYTNAVWLYRGSGATVENNRFTAPVCNQTYLGTPAAQQWIFVMLQTIAGKISVTGNAFVGGTTTNPALPPCAVFYSGIIGKLDIKDNYADHCARDNTGTHRLGVFDGYGDIVNVTIENNVATNVMAQFGRLSSTAHGKVLNNRVTWSANCEPGYNGYTVEGSIAFGGQKGVEDIEVRGNIFDDPSRRHEMIIGLMSYDFGKPATNIRIVDNIIPKAKICVYVAGPYYNVTIKGNRCPDYSGTLLSVLPVPGGHTMTTTEGVEANAVYDRLFVHGNFGRDLGAAGGNGIQHSLGTLTTAKVGYTEIIGNTLEAINGTGNGVVLLGYSTDTTRNVIVVRDNHIRGFGSCAYFREGGRYIWERNSCAGASGPEYNAFSGGYISLETNGDRLVPGGRGQAPGDAPARNGHGG